VVVPWCFACIPTYSICVDGGDLTSFLLPALCYTVYLCPPLLLSLCLSHPPWSVETASESPVISGISYGFDPIPLPIPFSESLWRNEGHLGALPVGFHLTIDSFSTTLGYVFPLPPGALHVSPLPPGALSHLNAVTDTYRDLTSPEIARKQSSRHPHQLRKRTQTVIRILW